MKSLLEMAGKDNLAAKYGLEKPAVPSGGYDIQRSSSKHLHEWLQYAGYYCDTSRSKAIWRAINNSPVKGAIIKGLTGAGKTYMPEKLKEVIPGSELFYFQCQLHTDENDLLQNMVPSEDTVSGVKLQNNVVIQAIEASREKTVILCIDEYDKSRPSTDTVMLEFLQSGGVHVNNVHYQGNLENLLIFLCANEERELSDFITRRLSMIYFDKLHPFYVGKALYSALPHNPFVTHAYAIYKVLYQVQNLPKIITTQEIMQLAKALERDPSDNIDSLIFQFVSKSAVAHKEITKALTTSNLFATLMSDPDALTPPVTIAPDKFQKAVETVRENYETFTPKPSLTAMKPQAAILKGIKLKTFEYDLTPKIETPINIDAIGGLVEFNKKAYDGFVKALLASKLIISSEDAKVINLIGDYKIEVMKQNDNFFLVLNMPLSMDDPELEPFLKVLISHIAYADDVLSGEFSFCSKRAIELEKTMNVILEAFGGEFSELIEVHSAKKDEILFGVKEFQCRMTLEGFELIGKLTTGESVRSYNEIVDIFNIIKKNNPKQ